MQSHIQLNSRIDSSEAVSYSSHYCDGRHRGLPVVIQRFAAFFILLALSPVIVVTMLLIRLESPGKCFFSQNRVGKYGRTFRMYKFRSMYLKTDSRYKEPSIENSDRDGVCLKFKQDPRISKVGQFIHKYSIDELPQLWNVVRGDMVLIGPRPALISEVEQYSNHALARLNGLPGLSGLWQVSGRADTDFETQVNLDRQYLDYQSVWLDLKIAIATVPSVLFAKGAY